VGGGDQPSKPHVSVGMLGADFEPTVDTSASQRFILARTGMIHALAADRAGIEVKAGDYLISVDGQEARSNQDVYSYFQDLAGNSSR